MKQVMAASSPPEPPEITDDLYELLGVRRDADAATIKAAWRRKCRAAHPDRESGDAELMARLNIAYETLSDPERRAEYDLTGEVRSAKNKRDAMARELLCAIVTTLIDKIGDDTNLVDAMRQQLAVGIDAAEVLMANLDQQERRRKLRIKRLKHKPKSLETNLLAKFLEDHLVRIAKVKSGIPLQQAAARRALEMLDEFEEEIELPIYQWTPFSGTYPFTGGI